jgi:hypothetical protein
VYGGGGGGGPPPPPPQPPTPKPPRHATRNGPRPPVAPQSADCQVGLGFLLPYTEGRNWRIDCVTTIRQAPGDLTSGEDHGRL